MPLMEITAMSVVPPPMSTTMFPKGSSIGRPAPIAAAMACSTRYTSLARARYAESCTARFSTGVISLGTPTTMRGRTSRRRLCAFWMKYVSIFSVTLKSAITPSFIGLMATTFAGVRPSISFASRPTASTSPLTLLIATIDGSFTTMPFPCENTSVFAVPRSMARSEENKLNIDLMLPPFLFGISFPLRRLPVRISEVCLVRLIPARIGLEAPGLAHSSISLMTDGALAEAESMIAPLAKLPSERQPIIAVFWTQPKFFGAIVSQAESLPRSAAQLAATGNLR